MQLHQLHAFLTLAHELNFRRAAVRLCMSQPALTAQIAELERDLGVRLFDRDRSGTRLTADGEALLPVARTAVAAVAEVQLAARRSPRYRRRFTVGLMDYGVGDLTWPLLRTFYDVRPDLDLHVLHVSFADALPWLHAGLIDVLVGIGPFGEEDGVVTTVATMAVSTVLPSWHPRSDAARIDTLWLAEHLSIRPPDGMGRTFAEFWTMQDAGGRPLRYLRRLDLGLRVNNMLEAISLGIVGAWPSKVPVGSGATVRPLAAERVAPLQVVTRHGVRQPDARQFCDMAALLAGTAAGSEH